MLYDSPSALAGTVGSGFDNRREDVASIQRRLGALGYIPEDPFDKPHGFIDERTTNGIREFQRAKGLADDGWLAPRGETERALEDAVAALARAKGRDWLAFADRADRTQHTFATKPKHGVDNQSRSEDDEEGIVLTRVRPIPGPRPSPGTQSPTQQPAFPPTSPPSRTRSSGPHLPPPRGGLPFGVPIPNDEPPSINDIPRALGLPPYPSLEDEVKRALPIPPRRTEPQIYIPEPGSPLRIPIIDGNPDGRPGKPDTVQQSKDISEAIEKACREVFGERAEFEQAPEHYYSPIPRKPGQRHGGSYADYLLRMTIGSITIDVVTDTYTPKVEKDPIAAEQRRFLKLQQNMSRHHGIVVRVPKAWALGETLDTDGLYKAAKELCEQIKNMLDRGELDADKARLRLEQKLKELVKSKPEAEPQGAPEPR